MNSHSAAVMVRMPAWPRACASAGFAAAPWWLLDAASVPAAASAERCTACGPPMWYREALCLLNRDLTAEGAQPGTADGFPAQRLELTSSIELLAVQAAMQGTEVSPCSMPAAKRTAWWLAGAQVRKDPPCSPSCPVGVTGLIVGESHQ